MNVHHAVQIARIPVLMALLVLAVTAKPPLVQALTRLDHAASWGPWSLLVVSGIAFVAVIGLTPPLAWIMWFGVGTIATFGVTTGNMFAHALALAWLVVVIATAVRQARRPAERGAPA